MRVPGGSEPPHPSPGWGWDEAAVGKVQGRGLLLALALQGWRRVPRPLGHPCFSWRLGRFLWHSQPLPSVPGARALEYVSN